MRLIDADALIKDIETYNVSDSCFQHWIELQPTVDAVPVKKGEWVPMHCSAVFGGSASAWGSSIAGYMCSECDEEVGTNDDYAYCPYCGSRNVKNDD